MGSSTMVGMGYRGKLEQQARGREMRAAGSTVPEIAAALGVARSSVSRWVHGLPLNRPRRLSPDGRPSSLAVRKQEEVARLMAEGIERIGTISERDLLIAGTALYAGEGAKRDGAVGFTNVDPRMVALFMAWLRRCFEIDDSRLRLRLYLHEGLDVAAAASFWTEVTSIPAAQHLTPYRAADDESRRRTKHPMGCATVTYSCSRTHRAVMGLVEALLTFEGSIRGGAIGSATDC